MTPENNIEDGYWRPEQAATFCGFNSTRTLLRAFGRGDLTGYRIGSRAVRFKKIDLENWIQQQNKKQNDNTK